MNRIKVISMFAGTLFPSFIFSQIQSAEFGPGTTNSIIIQSGKVIRIHSLIGSSRAGWTQLEDNGAGSWIASSNQSAGKATNGITIRLSSGNLISLSPYQVALASNDFYTAAATLSSITSVSPNTPLIIPGPIEILKAGDDVVLLVYEVLDNLGTSSLVQQASQGSSVVIPTSVAGDVDVKMEQSADNVTWTECLPGTYNSSTVKRFFRLRAVEK